MRSFHSCHSGRALIAFMSLLGLSIAGCDGTQGPDLPPLHDISYSDVLSVPAPGDSVLLAVCTGWVAHEYREVRVFMDTRPSVDENLHLNMHVVGRALSSDDRAVVEHRWGGDTLFVWCDQYAPMTWDYRLSAGKTTPEQSYIVADRVDVSVPSGAGFRYLGRWWPQLDK